MPSWLAQLDVPNVADLAPVPFPLAEILEDSVFYPTSGFNGFLVKGLCGAAHSFVYDDYGVSLEAAVTAARIVGFTGYRLIGLTEVAEAQLTPRGWAPSITICTDPSELGRMRWIAESGIHSIQMREGPMADHPDLFIWFDDGDEGAAAECLFRLRVDWPDLVETADALRASTGSAVGTLTALVAHGTVSRLVEESAGWEGCDFEAEERLGRMQAEREAGDESRISSEENTSESNSPG